ncbi:hypothetical protein [Brucella pseudogrignonensis]|uniref:CNNM transmembrane domain-containing protein n=1 Tax=Brucella pseudogrignonensis TaxID=419475 RepID=A0ABU1MFF5_9HYPH|nr:hypothetical protein [Brucella pseudogrignonensis]MDR6434361.1 hypothetical protein [Brucella pseudogrignonensis]
MISVYTADVVWSVTKSFKDIEEIERGTAKTLAKAVNAGEQNATVMLCNIKPEDFMDYINHEFEHNQPISVYSHFAISMMAFTIAVILSEVFGFIIGQTLG